MSHRESGHPTLFAAPQPPKDPKTAPQPKIVAAAKNHKEAQLAAALRANISKRKEAIKKRAEAKILKDN